MKTLNELKKTALQNAMKIFPFNTDVCDRVEREIDRIAQLGMVKEFCVALDIAAFLDSREEKSHFLGCGSCSLVAYLLDITNVNPLEYDLIFERYFSPKRKNVRVFGWFLKESILGELVNDLKQKYSRVEIETGKDIVLHVDEAEVQIVTSMDDVVGVRDLVENRVNSILDTPFTEDYMHLLHYIFRCDYDEIDRIRKILCGYNESKIDEIEMQLLQQCTERIPMKERFTIFDKIVKKIRHTISKAYYVCVVNILENRTPDDILESSFSDMDFT